MKPIPEALRLAAWLNEGAWHKMRLGDVEAAGRELRKLYLFNQELLAALQALIDMDVAYKRGPAVEAAVEAARTAIAKSRGESP